MTQTISNNVQCLCTRERGKGSRQDQISQVSHCPYGGADDWCNYFIPKRNFFCATTHLIVMNTFSLLLFCQGLELGKFYWVQMYYAVFDPHPHPYWLSPRTPLILAHPHALHPRARTCMPTCTPWWSRQPPRGCLLELVGSWERSDPVPAPYRGICTSLFGPLSGVMGSGGGRRGRAPIPNLTCMCTSGSKVFMTVIRTHCRITGTTEDANEAPPCSRLRTRHILLWYRENIYLNYSS